MSLPDLRALAPRPARAPQAPLVDARGIYEHEGAPVAYVRPSRRGWMMAEVGGRERYYPKRETAQRAARSVVEDHVYRARQVEQRRDDRRRDRSERWATVGWGVVWAVALIALMFVLMSGSPDPDADPNGCDSPGVAMQSPLC